jgi:hypothetical protein
MDLVTTRETMLECATHGRQRSAIVCRHLLAHGQTVWVGFIPDEEPNQPTAVCEACDVRVRDDGWEPIANELDLVCRRCFDELKRAQDALY